MAELDVLEWEADGLMLSTDPFCVTDTQGLEDTADYDVEAHEQWVDGAAPGRVRLRDREVLLDIGVTDPTEAEKDALRAAFSRRTDGAPKVLRWRHLGVTKRVSYLPPRSGAPLTMPGDEQHLVHDMPKAKARLWCPDPVIYSDAETTTNFEVVGGVSDTKTLTNAGAFTAESGAMSWTMMGGTGGAVQPYLSHVDFPDERWVLADELPAGFTVTVDADHVTRFADLIATSLAQGPGGSPVPIWPLLRPGANSIRVGAASGALAATVKHRSTW